MMKYQRNSRKIVMEWKISVVVRETLLLDAGMERGCLRQRNSACAAREIGLSSTPNHDDPAPFDAADSTVASTAIIDPTTQKTTEHSPVTDVLHEEHS
jgi:hypothetical protein